SAAFRRPASFAGDRARCGIARQIRGCLGAGTEPKYAFVRLRAAGVRDFAFAAALAEVEAKDNALNYPPRICTIMTTLSHRGIRQMGRPPIRACFAFALPGLLVALVILYSAAGIAHAQDSTPYDDKLM